MALDDDKRGAATLRVGISSQLITAALAALAVEGTLVVFFLDKRDVGLSFYICAFISSVAFIASIYCGGYGAGNVARDGYSGTWANETGKNEFQFQTLLCLLGIAAFFGLLFSSGKPKNEASQEDIKALKKEVQMLTQELKKHTTQIRDLQKRLPEPNAGRNGPPRR